MPGTTAAQREQKEREAKEAAEKAARRAKWCDVSFPNPPMTDRPNKGHVPEPRTFTRETRDRDQGYER